MPNAAFQCLSWWFYTEPLAPVCERKLTDTILNDQLAYHWPKTKVRTINQNMIKIKSLSHLDIDICRNRYANNTTCDITLHNVRCLKDFLYCTVLQNKIDKTAFVYTYKAKKIVRPSICMCVE